MCFPDICKLVAQQSALRSPNSNRLSSIVVHGSWSRWVSWSARTVTCRLCLYVPLSLCLSLVSTVCPPLQCTAHGRDGSVGPSARSYAASVCLSVSLSLCLSICLSLVSTVCPPLQCTAPGRDGSVGPSARSHAASVCLSLYPSVSLSVPRFNSMSSITVHGSWSRWVSWSECTVTCGLCLSVSISLCLSVCPSFQQYVLHYSARLLVAMGQLVRVHGHMRPLSVCLYIPLSLCLSLVSTVCPPLQCTAPGRDGSVGPSARSHAASVCLSLYPSVSLSVPRFNSMSSITVHGSWSRWVSWSECTVTCGLGSQFRTRTCDDPEPTNGGRSCKGSKKETKTCMPTECPSTLATYRLT